MRWKPPKPTARSSATVRGIGRHPLFRQKNPGRAVADVDVGDSLLAGAGAVLDAILAGRIVPYTGTETLSNGELGLVAKRLTPEQEKILAYRVQTFGDTDARNTLVTKNIGLVRVIAKKNTWFNAPNEREDYIQEGVMGLLRAAETFDPRRDIKFSTYAAYWIFAKMQRYKQRLDVDDEPNIPQLGMSGSAKDGTGAVKYDDSATHYVDARGVRRRRRKSVVCLDAPVPGLEGERQTIGDSIPDGAPLIDEVVFADMSDERVREVLLDIAEGLPPPAKAGEGSGEGGRERAVKPSELDTRRDWRQKKRRAIIRAIVLRRLLSPDPDTLDAIASGFGNSREWARLVEKQILSEAAIRLGLLVQP